MVIRMLTVPVFLAALTFTSVAWAASDDYFAKQVAKVSGGRAGVSASFDIDGVKGLILRGKNPDSSQLTGHEILAFGFADGFITLSGDVYNADGTNLTQRCQPMLNRQIIQNTIGLYQSKKLQAAGTPVKTIFVFFDPMCPNCKAFESSDMPAWFEKENVQLLWVPVSIFDRSEKDAALFLDKRKWPSDTKGCIPCSQTPSTASSKAIVDNTKRLLRIYEADDIVAPFFVWLTDDKAGRPDEMGFAYHLGVPTVEQAKGFLPQIAPVMSQNYDVLESEVSK